jgi:hypothetical protein
VRGLPTLDELVVPRHQASLSVGRARRRARTGEALGVIASDLARASDLSCLELAAPLLTTCYAEGTLETSAAAMNEAWREAERALDAFTPGDEGG